MVILIKYGGKPELFEEKKLFASIFNAALNCHKSDEESKKIADEIVEHIHKFIEGKDHIYSNDIESKVIEHCYDEDVKLMYKHHSDIN